MARGKQESRSKHSKPHKASKGHNEQERVGKSNQQGREKGKQSPQSSTKTNCSNCSKHGHHQKNCIEPCGNCKGKGHKRADCRKLQFCKSCNWTGHKTADCKRCKYCNGKDHDSESCTDEVRKVAYEITHCSQCKTNGHDDASCKNPYFSKIKATSTDPAALAALSSLPALPALPIPNGLPASAAHTAPSTLPNHTATRTTRTNYHPKAQPTTTLPTGPIPFIPPPAALTVQRAGDTLTYDPQAPLTHPDYCMFCNMSNTHMSLYCLNFAAQTAYRKSAINCARCSYAGHDAPHCQHPLPGRATAPVAVRLPAHAVSVNQWFHLPSTFAKYTDLPDAYRARMFRNACDFNATYLLVANQAEMHFRRYTLACRCCGGVGGLVRVASDEVMAGSDFERHSSRLLRDREVAFEFVCDCFEARGLIWTHAEKYDRFGRLIDEYLR